MSVASQIPYNVAIGNGASTVYPYTWQALQAGDVAVYWDGAQKFNGIDFTIAGLGLLTGGNITFYLAPPNGTRVTITRQMIKKRDTDYQQLGDFLTPVVNPDFDRALLISQELDAADARAIRVAPYEQGSNMLLPPKATRASQYLYFDVNGDLALAVALASGTLSQSTIGGFLTPQTPAEIAAGVVPVKTWYPEGDVRRYGAFLDGVIDDTTYLQNWAKVGGELSWPVVKTAKVSAEIPLYSNTAITGARGAQITQISADLSIFRATTQTKITVTGMHFKQTNWGGAAYVAHIVFDTCTHCHAEGNEFEGVQWSGIYLRAAQYCTVRKNWFHDSFPQQNLTFTVAPAAGATSGTLTAPWTLATGAYTVLFTETSGGAPEGRQVSFVNGGTSASWVGAPPVLGGLGANCNAGIVVQATSDSSDITIHSSPSAAANFNLIEGNHCFSNTLEVGIELQDPYNGVLSVHNTIRDNKITAHLGYGILSYMPDAGDSYNDIIGNTIRDISGSYAFNPSSGAGIYVTGAGIGGTKVIANTIINCCINTGNASLAPGAIGIAGVTTTGGAPLTVANNVISGMTQYHGILLTGVGNGAAVVGNAIRMPSTNSIGHAITITNCDGIACAANSIFVATGTNAIRGYLIQGLGGINCTNISITGGAVRGGHFAQVETTGTGGGLVVGLTLNGVTLDEGDSSCICLQLASATDVTVNGGFMHNAGALVVNQASCLNVVYSGVRFKGGTPLLQFVGTNTGTFVDKNCRGLSAAAINNAGTGAIVEMLLAAVPASGTFAVGDRVVQLTPVVGNPKGWRCTVAGTPGTWVSEGNL